MIILGTNSIKDTGFDVANSLRFNDGSSDYLTRTNSGTGSTSKSTISLWTKRSSTNSYQDIWESYSSGENYFRFRFRDDNRLDMQSDISNSTVFLKRTTRKFRDVSAWYHICVAIDLTQSNADKIKLYINGTRETAFDNSTDLTSTSQQFAGGGGGYNFTIGRHPSNDAYYDGYMSEYVFVDGQALAPTDFGEFDEDSGIWKPINVSGLTFGTNGFYLDFEDSSALGNDKAGSNNFTVNNLTAIDQSTDTCTNNFATLNSLDTFYTSSTLSDGNLTLVGGSTHANNTATIGLARGKWYWETKVSDWQGSNNSAIGITSQSPTATNYEYYNQSGSIIGYGYYSSGSVFGGGSTIASGYGSASGTHYISVALDLDNNKIAWGYDGTFQGSANPATGANMLAITDPSSLLTGLYFPAFSNLTGNKTFNVNFGSPPYSESGGNSDGNGYGNFKTAPPSGYFALNTKNLAEYG